MSSNSETSTSIASDVTGSQTQRKFLSQWKLIFPWAQTEGEQNEVVVFCQDCRKVGLRMNLQLVNLDPQKVGRRNISEDMLCLMML